MYVVCVWVCVGVCGCGTWLWWCDVVASVCAMCVYVCVVCSVCFWWRGVCVCVRIREAYALIRRLQRQRGQVVLSNQRQHSGLTDWPG